MSDIGGATGKTPEQTQYPSFQSAGGVTPQQGALAEYDYGQNLLEGQAQFGGGDEGGGNALSTMATQVAGGANMGKAENLATSSDADQNAQYGAYGNAIKTDQQNNENQLAASQQTTSDLGNLAKAAGTAVAFA